MNKPFRPAPKRCVSCRRDYEFTHPWARQLKLCKPCADVFVTRMNRLRGRRG